MDSLRIGDADRESAVELLSEQYALGRLTRDEFDERSDAVWSARTQGDLAPVFADLPVRRPAGQPAGRRPRGRAPQGLPFVPVVIALVVLTAITHLPFVLLLLVGFFCVGRWRHHGSWAPRGHQDPYAGRY